MSIELQMAFDGLLIVFLGLQLRKNYLIKKAFIANYQALIALTKEVRMHSDLIALQTDFLDSHEADINGLLNKKGKK